MNFEIPEIRNLVTDGRKFYSVTDAVNVYAPGCKWSGDGQIYLETNQGREPYSDEPTIADIINKLKPPELSGFDKILKGIMDVPKPK